jgi:cell division protein FtsL
MNNKMENNKYKTEEKTGRRVSPLKAIFIFIIVAIIITFHINNVLTVNTLVVENDILQKKLSKLEEQNYALSNDIERLSSIQRILPLAKEIGLETSTEESNYFEIKK